jgi:purine-nucleoside phosphorylase
MSTVAEAIVARQLGLRVAGLSCITNMAAGLSKKIISHKEVLESGALHRETASIILNQFVREAGKLMN